MSGLKRAFMTLGLLQALCCFSGLFAPATAQQLGIPQNEILTISTEVLFANSAFGRRIIDEIEAEGAVLAAENERIVSELSREERELTERRKTMEPDAFRALAQAFDQKVQTNRETQKAKLDALAERGEQARSAFVELVRPVLAGLMRETGATVILERSSVFLSLDSADITAIAISRIDAAIGDGSSLEPGADN